MHAHRVTETVKRRAPYLWYLQQHAVTHTTATASTAPDTMTPMTRAVTSPRLLEASDGGGGFREEEDGLDVLAGVGEWKGGADELGGVADVVTVGIKPSPSPDPEPEPTNKFIHSSGHGVAPTAEVGVPVKLGLGKEPLCISVL